MLSLKIQLGFVYLVLSRTLKAKGALIVVDIATYLGMKNDEAQTC